MKARAKILGPVHEKYHKIMRAANDLARLHFSAVSPEPWLIALKIRDATTLPKVLRKVWSLLYL